VPPSLQETVFVASITSLAIQQVNELIFGSWLTIKLQQQFPLEEDRAARKKLYMGTAAIIVGIVIAFSAQINLFVLTASTQSGLVLTIFQTIVSGIILGSGADISNSLVKWLDAAKEIKKSAAELNAPAAPNTVVTTNAVVAPDGTVMPGVTLTPVPGVAVTVIPPTPTPTVNSPIKLAATVMNTTEPGVTWKLRDQNSGATLAADGTFKAAKAGAYDVLAISQVDPRAVGRATLTVTG